LVRADGKSKPRPNSSPKGVKVTQGRRQGGWDVKKKVRDRETLGTIEKGKVKADALGEPSGGTR